VKKNYSDSEVISSCEKMIYNGVHAEVIATALAGFGYDRERMREGEQILARTKEIRRDNHEAKCLAMEARRVWELSWRDLEKLYRRVRKLAKVWFERDPEQLQSLALEGKVSQVYIPFMAVVESFLSAVDSSVLDQLAVYQITQTTIDELTVLVSRTKQLRTDYVQKKSHAEALTVQKRAAIVALSRWCAGYLKIARIAMEERPLMLEALGVGVK